MIYLEFIFPCRKKQIASNVPLVKQTYTMVYSTALPSQMTVLKNIIMSLCPILGCLYFISFSISHSISRVTDNELPSN